MTGRGRHAQVGHLGVLVTLAVAAGCGRLGFEFGGAGSPDAMPGSPDAMPGSPDAMPGSPDTPSTPPIDAAIQPPDAVLAAGDCGAAMLLDDEFDDGPPGPTFTALPAGGLTLSETDGAFTVTFAASVATGRYAGYESTSTFPFGSCFLVQVDELPVDQGIIYMKVMAGARNFEFMVYDGTLYLRHLDGTLFNDLTLDLDPVAHRHWRLRTSSDTGTDTVFWDTSADGVTYAELVSLEVAGISTMSFEMGAGAPGPTTNGGAARFERARVLGAP